MNWTKDLRYYAKRYRLAYNAIIDIYSIEVQAMASVTVRNLSDETHRALRVRAAMHGRSTEAEIRAILENTVRPENRIKLGTLLAEIGLEAGGADLEIERDKSTTEPLNFE